jgi:hypothetical protein
MPRRKRPDPAATSGWEGEVRQEKIDSAVASCLRADGPKAYREAYDAAKLLKEKGKHPDEIREAVRRTPHKQAYSAEDSPQRGDQKKIHNTVEDYLCDAARQGAEDALADRAPEYQSPPGY